jgi:gluconate kinase
MMSTLPSHSMVVVFGMPGAGKTTISNEALKKLETNNKNANSQPPCISLDLDVCVPSWMKDNFAQGIYPTLDQRNQFATTACDYVDAEIKKIGIDQKKNHDGAGTDTSSLLIIISFSFVNTDLRDHFRARFPAAKWALVDVVKSTAQERIDKREGHFYKGAPSKSNSESKTKQQDTTETVKEETVVGDGDSDNSEWEFAPVDFDHVKLDGLISVEENADRVIQMLIES